MCLHCALNLGSVLENADGTGDIDLPIWRNSMTLAYLSGLTEARMRAGAYSALEASKTAIISGIFVISATRERAGFA